MSVEVTLDGIDMTADCFSCKLRPLGKLKSPMVDVCIQRTVRTCMKMCAVEMCIKNKLEVNLHQLRELITEVR